MEQQMEINVNKIAKVYSGKIGCMCGCRGKYSYNEGVPHEDWQGAVSVRSVKIMARKVMSDPRANFDESTEYVFVEDRAKGTIKVVYFKQIG
jgi:hypothetical protein